MQCKLGNRSLYYDIRGEGRPLVLLHGMGVDHRHMLGDFEPFFEQRPGWQRVYFDMPGMGRSNGEAAGINSNDDMLDVILAFIDKVIPGQQFALAGISYGAFMARGVLHRRQATLDGMLLVVPPILPKETRTVPEHVTLVEDPTVFSGLDPDVAEAFRSMAVVQSNNVLEPFVSRIIPAVGLMDPTLEPRLRAQYAFSFDVDNLDEPFGGPTLFLVGRQDSECGYKDGWPILDNYPRASYVVLDRAGHFLVSEQESLYSALVDEWLDRVEEYNEKKP